MMPGSGDIHGLLETVMRRGELSLRAMRQLSDAVAGRNVPAPSRLDRVVRKILRHPVRFTRHNAQVADLIISAGAAGISRAELMAALGWKATQVSAAIAAIDLELAGRCYLFGDPAPVCLGRVDARRYAFMLRQTGGDA